MTRYYLDTSIAVDALLAGGVRFIEKTARNPVYTDFEDILGEGV